MTVTCPCDSSRGHGGQTGRFLSNSAQTMEEVTLPQLTAKSLFDCLHPKTNRALGIVEIKTLSP